jgi:hypothetical protein
MKKLTRKQVAEGLQAVPMDIVLLGAASAKEKKLTAKQRKFAEALAMGETKAGAYRAAYDTNTAPIHQGHAGHRLAQNPKIAAQVDALVLANEARKHATPAALRALVIERLTAHAIDEDIKPAQRLRALELLGKVTEVAAFTERREVVTHTDAGQLRERLIQSLRQAIQATATDASAPGATLLAELGRADAEVIEPLEHADADAGGQDAKPGQDPGNENPGETNPPHPHPPEADSTTGATHAQCSTHPIHPVTHSCVTLDPPSTNPNNQLNPESVIKSMT